ncbi:MAG: VOC family protein [Polyangiaceae bacterium]|nr:VOC family protein [Polyangiaceae bacterium]
MNLLGLDHVQIAIPRGAEDRARAFYAGVLGLREVPKPAALAARGGAWFVAGEQGLHVGVEEPFQPAKKAHPAFRLASAGDVRALAAHLESLGIEVRWANETPEHVRFHIDDPFGNRLELTAPAH